MKLDRRTFVAGGIAAIAGCGGSRGPAEGYALVANQEGKSVAAVDLRVLAVIRHIRMDAAPTSVLAHPTKSVFYVLTPETGAIHEITAERLAVTRSVSLSGPADQIQLGRDGASVWALSRSSRKLRRIAVDSLSIQQTISLPETPEEFDISEERALVSYGDHGAALYDLASGKQQSWLRTPSPAGAVAFRQDGRQLLVAQPAGRMLSIYESKSGGVVTHLPLALEPEHLCFNRDGGQLFITGKGRDALVVVFPYITQVAETQLVGHAPGAMAASLEYLFVASPQAGDVSVVDIETRKVIAVVAVGAEPVAITVTPSNRYALVLNRQSGDMGVLLIPAISATRAKRAALFTMIPVGASPVSAAVQMG